VTARSSLPAAGILVQVDNLHLRAGHELSEGLPVLREPALAASEGRNAESAAGIE